MNDVDLIIIGGGDAGMSAARTAAEFGAKAVLIEQNRLGGVSDCAIPTRILSQESGSWSRNQWPEFRERVSDFSIRLVQKWEEEFAQLGVDRIAGPAEISGPNTVSVNPGSAEEIMYRGKAVIVATGSSHKKVDSIPFDGTSIFGCDEVHAWESLPESLLIAGTDAAGVELAQWMMRMGVRVFLCDAEPRVLSDLDPDLIEVAEHALKQTKAKLLNRKTIQSIYREGGSIQVTLDGGVQFSVERVVFSGERIVEALPFGSGVSKPDRGRQGELLVNERMATTQAGVYAAGGVTGHSHCPVRSQEEGRVAATNALGKKRIFRPEVVPRVVRIQPEIACVGSTLDLAHHFGFRGVEGQSRCMMGYETGQRGQLPAGFRLVADRDSKAVIGGQAWGEGALVLVSIVQFAIRKGLAPRDLVQIPATLEGPMSRLQEAARDCHRALDQRL